MLQTTNPHALEKLHYTASGKLLLFGEYLVLRQATCLAAPLSTGQEMQVLPHSESGIRWQCYESGKPWLTVRFSEDLSIGDTTDKKQALIVQGLLSFIKEKAPEKVTGGLLFRFDLSFNRAFGLGSSSTLISLLSQWSGVDAYDLLAASFGGSGYDIAAATAAGPFVYSMSNRIERECTLPESITRHLLFVYSGRKQRSAEAIAGFGEKTVHRQVIEAMNNIVNTAAQCTHIDIWERLMKESEDLLSGILSQPAVKAQYFQDYPYPIKSLGAWGGDFMMASCRDVSEGKAYFQRQERQPVFTYNELMK